ncbi:ABC transporter permease [Lachnotalea sp. AF33-28]|uniref:ABC transporter permease n=1 Tax=Lachnotalea sp. AF33-28 TaxID=2292046 RepID=UPI0018F2BC9C|nr:ABC transporter permease subunit [Lachnotalea sp. AF33-28]
MKPQHKKKERVRQRMKPQGLTAKRKKPGGGYFRKYAFLHLMVLPGLIYFLVFKYTPMYGLIIAFKNYRGAAGGLQGIFQADWVGLDNFITFFKSVYFTRVLRNTLLISFYRIIFMFPAPVLLALMINEIGNRHAKKTVQTITYMPYFLSWVVVAGLMNILLSPTSGPINAILEKIGLEPIYFMGDSRYFRSMLVISEIWKNIGYSSIVYLAAISTIDQEQFEAARVDGANRLQQIRYITLPAISGIVAVMLILSVGRILDDNFEQILNMYSPAVYEVSDVFETYIYRSGIVDGNFSYTAAVGLFKSFIALLLIWGTDRVTKKLGSDGLF